MEKKICEQLNILASPRYVYLIYTQSTQCMLAKVRIDTGNAGNIMATG
jgi:hypothetical protein